MLCVLPMCRPCLRVHTPLLSLPMLTTLSPENGGGFNITGATRVEDVKGESGNGKGENGERKGESGEGNAVYDLLGREVYNPSGGVYIVNGKKFIVR